MSAPGVAGQDAEERSSTTMGPPGTNPPGARRRSRMSVHSFLPGSVFKAPPPAPSPVPDEICFEAIKAGVDAMPPGVKMLLNSGA